MTAWRAAMVATREPLMKDCHKCTRAGMHSHPALRRNCTGVGPNGEAPRERPDAATLPDTRWWSGQGNGTFARYLSRHVRPTTRDEAPALRCCPTLYVTPWLAQVIQAEACHADGWRVPVESAPQWWRAVTLAMSAERKAIRAASRGR